jgi:hypothetical protein
MRMRRQAFGRESAPKDVAPLTVMIVFSRIAWRRHSGTGPDSHGRR